MNRLKSIITATLLLPALVAGWATAPVEVARLGATNAMLRVNPESRWLMMPVEERVPDSRVDILLNGEVVKTIFVRFATNRVDYKVPLDLAPYQGQGDLLLNIVTPEDRTYSRDAGEDILWDEFALTDGFSTENVEKYRPLFHHTPLYGWMNDPNGMFYRDGVWHLYYQHNPYGSKWQNMTWGHSSSRDLVNWEHHPLAIEPNGLGTVFSGSAAIDHDNTAGFGKDALIAMYTSAGTSQIQSLAHSTDGGMTFDIYPGNPVITTFGEARDPNFFFNEKTARWNLLLAHALEHEMLVYSSPDLKEWTLESSFGQGYGAQRGVWECPDLFELPVRGTDQTRWVLICNINPGGPFGGSAAQYFVGDFDGKEFTPDSDPKTTKWMDYGKDHYAAVSFSGAPDGRHTTIAWMSNWEYANEVPTMQFRSANTLPRDHDLFVAPDGETYLGVFPAQEMVKMRGHGSHHKGASLEQKEHRYNLPKANDGICEVVVSFDEGDAKKVVFTLANELGENVEMVYDASAKTFAMDRRKSGDTSFSKHFPVKTVAPTHQEDGRLTLRLFIDRCSLEAFDGEGRFAMTNLVFPTEPYSDLRVKAVGGKAKLESLDIYPINR